jgi:transcriptional regulator with XRE-family HTH domain
MNTWEIEQARRIGGEVQRLRKESKKSAQWLADRTDELGLKITRQAIADLENGRRRYVTTAELIVLAVALNTAPVNLVYPGPYFQRIEFTPGVEMVEVVAAEWFSGNRDWRLDDALTEEQMAGSELMEKNTRLLYLHREFIEALGAVRKLKERADFDNDRELIEYYEKRIEDLKKAIELGELPHDDVRAEIYD